MAAFLILIAVLMICPSVFIPVCLILVAIGLGMK